VLGLQMSWMSPILIGVALDSIRCGLYPAPVTYEESLLEGHSVEPGREEEQDDH
jgi:hypothetical protein